MDTRTSPARLRIERIREALAAHGVAALLVPSSDPHLSEYLPERWQGRQWASGFTGSVGHAGRHAPTPRPCSPTAATGCRPSASSPAAASSWSRSATGASTRPHRLAVPATWRPARPSRSTATCSAWRRRASSRPSSAAAASACAAISTCSARPGPIVRKPRRRRSTSMPRRTRRRPAANASGAYAPRCARPAPPTISSRPSTTSPGYSTCVAPTSASTRSSSPTCWSTRTRRPCSSAPARSIAALAARLADDGVRLADYGEAGAALAALPADAALLIDPRRITLGTRQRTQARIVESTNPSTLAKSRKSAAEAAQRAPGDDRGRRGDVRVLRLVRGRARRLLAPRSDHRADDRRAADRGKSPARGLRRPELRHDRGVQRQRRHAALPRDRRLARGDRGRRPAPDRLWRPVPLRHDRHHAHVAGRLRQRRRSGATSPSSCAARSRSAAARFPRGTPSPMLDAIARAPLWAARPRLRPRHRPRRRLLPQRPRGAADDLARRRRAGHGDGAGHDHQRRAGPLPAGPLGRAGREPRPRRAGRRRRGGHRVRRVPRIRDADAVPDRRALPRADPAAQRRDRLARRLSRDGARSASDRTWPATRSPGCCAARRRSEARRRRAPSSVGSRGNSSPHSAAPVASGFLAAALPLPRVRAKPSRLHPSRSPS